MTQTWKMPHVTEYYILISTGNYLFSSFVALEIVILYKKKISWFRLLNVNGIFKQNIPEMAFKKTDCSSKNKHCFTFSILKASSDSVIFSILRWFLCGKSLKPGCWLMESPDWTGRLGLRWVKGGNKGGGTFLLAVLLLPSQ